MNGKRFFWLVVFEKSTSIEVPQPAAEGDYDAPRPVIQTTVERWNRTGTVAVSPGQDTGGVIEDIVTSCKKSGEPLVPADAFLTNVVLLPNRLV